MTRVDVAAWTDFAEAVATVGAALTGLLVVAVSINLTAILADARLPGRALGTLLLFAVPILPALALLVPGQPDAVLGIELLGILALVAPLMSVLARPSRRSAEQPRVAWVVASLVPVVLLVGGVTVAGVGLLAGTTWGLYGLAVAVAASIVGGLANTWVLLVEIQR